MTEGGHRALQGGWVAREVSSCAAAYQRSLGINVNLVWGVVLLIFGLLMMYFAKRARARAVSEEPRSQTGGTVRRSLH